jgi:uncharacterized protein (TIGR00369 family)
MNTVPKPNIWKKEFTLETLNQRGANSAVEHMGVIITEVTSDTVIATMPVDNRTKQPIGILHGGASVFLAESIASLAANMTLDDNYYCVGQEINANHLRPVTQGLVTARTIPIHLGKASQVWSIEIRDEHKKLVCISRITMAILRKVTEKNQ